MNNKGFTLVEVLGVVIIIAIILTLTIPNVIGTLNNSKRGAYNVMLDNIITVSESFYTECEFLGDIYEDGVLVSCPSDGEVIIKLQTLVDYGYLTGSNYVDNNSGITRRKIVNPMTQDDIGDCKIKITKKRTGSNIDDYTWSYTVKAVSGNASFCPKNADLEKVVNKR